jgi:hypothetical protein
MYSVKPGADLWKQEIIVTVTLREYIEELIALEKTHGPGLQVEKWTVGEGRHAAELPRIAYAKINDPQNPNRVRPPTPSFWHKVHDRPDQKGEVVIRV